MKEATEKTMNSMRSSGLQKDKIIWISINATLLGIEAFRAVITPDSVKVLNKLDKVYQLRSVSYLQRNQPPAF